MLSKEYKTKQSPNSSKQFVMVR